MTLRDKKTGEVTRRLLRECSASRRTVGGHHGTVRGGEIVAVERARGSGDEEQTRAVDRVAHGERGRREGREEVSGVTLCKRIAFTRSSRGRETLETAAKLGGAEDVKGTTERLLSDLGLTACADTRVGGEDARDQPAERSDWRWECSSSKAPWPFFADEPTSGLDSFQAERAMTTLSRLAREQNKTVVCSIHQPRSSIVRVVGRLCISSRLVSRTLVP